MEIYFSNWSSIIMDGNNDDDWWIFCRFKRSFTRYYWRFNWWYIRDNDASYCTTICKKNRGWRSYCFRSFCTLGYVFEAGVGYVFGKRGENRKSVEDLKLPKNFEFLQDTYLSLMVVMAPLFLVTVLFAGEDFSSKLSGDTNYIMYAFYNLYSL